MASTTLFAPQVQSIQPAFVYVYNKEESLGEVKIYFSLSSYNDISEIGYVMFSIIDPNQISGYGSNSMLKKESFPLGYGAITVSEVKQDNSTKKYYITLNLLSDYFKTFTTNQFYQVQLYFIDKNVTLEKNNSDTLYSIRNDIFINKKDYISEVSQTTLIRPISKPEIYLDGFEGDFRIDPKLNSISGRVEYEDGSTIEAIVEYQVVVKYGDMEDYRSPIIYNYDGVSFRTKLKDFYIPTQGYHRLIVYYKTINNYSGEKTFEWVNQDGESQGNFIKSININANQSNGTIEIDLSFLSSQKGKIITIERASYIENFTKWQTIHIVNLPVDKEVFKYKWVDFSIESGVLYQYRIWSNDKYQSSPSVVCSFEDIFLSNENKCFAIRFDPNISSLKYVTQEAITNTLGGKYPVIRRNGDTKYKQFTLSGLISFEGDKDSDIDTTFDSTGASINKYVSNNNSSMFFSRNEAFKYAKEYEFYKNRQLSDYYFEKRFRDIVMEFLTDGSVKLFRSEAEGNMLIYLSNISFTPNKILGRMIYSFSATVTECGEVNEENLNKYKIVITDGKYITEDQYSINGYIVDGTPYLTLGQGIVKNESDYLLNATYEEVQVSE